MPPGKGSEGPINAPKVLKRKEPPSSSSNGQSTQRRAAKHVKRLDSRAILTQKADAALNNGELDLQAFLKSREFEIKALQDGMERSKNSRTARAFQQVPHELRRRTASHIVKRVPKRLQKRAKKEMKEDNTPTVDPSKRRPGTSRARLRAETAKRLGILAGRKKVRKEKAGIETRPARPKIRRDRLNDPPKQMSKFRKRQIGKTWLPTHLWHAKRATMTEPKNPLWRFAMPITSTEKSYRPTHRAGGARGCVAWDTSYMSTIGLEGPAASLEKVLRRLGITEKGVWEKRGEKWRQGKRSWSGWLSRKVNDEIVQICPSTIFWCPQEPVTAVDKSDDQPKKPPNRQLFLRIHPSAFLETWTEILQLSKDQRPAVHAVDLRFEIGSIEITGPGSTESLLGIIHPIEPKGETKDKHADTFKSLAGVTNPSSLPSNALLSFNILDPRLRYPPRQVQLPDPRDEDSNFNLLELLSSWPVDASTPSTGLFDREARFNATLLPTQKAINRRKSQARPGCYAAITEKDPAIPITLLTSKATNSSSAAAQGTWTLLAPWKCILPLWHGLMHYPLSSGGNPRFGGLDEVRQLHFEQGVPWFPADYPGTAAGFAWETEERARRKGEWDRRPRGKRVEWSSLDLGAGRKGELGLGWASDFERSIEMDTLPSTIPIDSGASTTEDTQMTDASAPPKKAEPAACIQPTHLSHQAFALLLSNPNVPSALSAATTSPSTIATIRLTLVSRGIAGPCARIYRLPSRQTSIEANPPPSTREEWLSLLPPSKAQPPNANPRSNPNPNRKNGTLPRRLPLNVPLSKRIRLLAQTLLQPPPQQPPPQGQGQGHPFKEGGGGEGEGEEEGPLVPNEEDLIGFVTTGGFSLAEGKGVSMGSVFVNRVLDGLRREIKEEGDEKNGNGNGVGRLVIVRNAGEKVGRLARWEAV